MDIDNFPYGNLVCKVEPEDDGNSENFHRIEYPIDFEEIKVEGHGHQTVSKDVVDSGSIKQEIGETDKIFVADGLIPLENSKFTCDICNKDFNKYYMNSHKLTHTAEKRHKCDQCPAKFHHKSNLNKHKLTHTAEKPFGCEICLSKFRGKASLNRHMLIHTGERPFQCEICFAKFRDKSSLVTHAILHTDDDYKPFKCSFCPLTFRHKSNLTQHKYTHAPEKPFQCDDCLKKYFSKKSLKAHYLKAHPTKLDT